MVVVTCKLYINLRITRMTYNPIIRNAVSDEEDGEGLALHVVNPSADN